MDYQAVTSVTHNGNIHADRLGYEVGGMCPRQSEWNIVMSSLGTCRTKGLINSCKTIKEDLCVKRMA